MRVILYLLIVLLVAPLPGTAQPASGGELKGAITYKTDNGRTYADAGAEVIIYFIDSIKLPGHNYDKRHAEDSIVNNALLATIYYDEWEHTPIGRTQRDMVRKLKKLDAFPEDKLHDLDNKAATIIRERERKQYAKVIADGTGHYSVKLNAGYYGIIIRSRHLHSHSVSEKYGNILLDHVEIKPGQTVVRNEEML